MLAKRDFDVLCMIPSIGGIDEEQLGGSANKDIDLQHYPPHTDTAETFTGTHTTFDTIASLERFIFIVMIHLSAAVEHTHSTL